MIKINHFGNAAPIPWHTPNLPDDVDCIRIIGNYFQTGRQITEITGQSDVLTYLKFPKKIVEKIARSSTNEIYLTYGYHKDLSLGARRKGYTLIAFEMNNDNLELEGDYLMWDSLVQGTENSKRNISFSDMKGIIKEYRDNHPILTLGSTGDLLKGHVFNIEHWKQVNDDVRNLLDAHLILAFHTSETGMNGNEGYTWILLGANYAGILTGTSDPIFDFCEPCPTECPQNDNLLES